MKKIAIVLGLLMGALNAQAGIKCDSRFFNSDKGEALSEELIEEARIGIREKLVQKGLELVKFKQTSAVYSNFTWEDFKVVATKDGVTYKSKHAGYLKLAGVEEKFDGLGNVIERDCIVYLSVMPGSLYNQDTGREVLEFKHHTKEVKIKMPL